MKILITYGFHKSGHFHVANTIAEEANKRQHDVTVTSIYDGSRFFSETYKGLFLEFEKACVPHMPDVLDNNDLMERLALELGEKISVNLDDYDAVISTHQITTNLLARYKQAQGLQTYLAECNVNYDEFPILPHKSIDAYFGARTKGDVIASTQEKQHETGIPIRETFTYNPDEKQNRIVIVGGIHGMGGMEEALNASMQAQHDYQIRVITGNNEELRSYLENNISDTRVQITGFEQHMDEVYRTSKIIISKGSGSTIAEGLATGNILLFPPPTLFWEGMGADYISKHHAGICLSGNQERDSAMIESITTNETIYNWLKNNALALKRPHATKNLLDIVENKKIGQAPLRDNLLNLRDRLEARATITSTSGQEGIDKEASNYVMSKLQDYVRKRLQ